MPLRSKLYTAFIATLIAVALPILAVPIEDQLVTRNYKLDVLKIQKLSETTIADTAPPPLTSPSNFLRALFATNGIIFATSLLTTNVDSFKNEKAFYYNERTGELQLRATRRDIPKFEKHLAELSPDPPPVKTETIWVKVQVPHRSWVDASILQPDMFFPDLIETPSITTVQWRRLSVPISAPSISSFTPIVSPPAINPTLLIRSESDRP